MDLNRHVYIASHTLKCQIPRDRAIGAAIKRIMVMCAPPLPPINHKYQPLNKNTFVKWVSSLEQVSDFKRNSWVVFVTC